MKIGFFDSGLGGLTVLNAVIKELPEYDYHFYGDTAHIPYGDKTEKEIFTYTKNGIEYLFDHECMLVIVACNTASAETLRTLQTEYLPHVYPDRKLLGVVIPTIESVSESGCRNILLLATKRTVDSRKYEIELRKLKNENVELTTVAMPELVPLIELGETNEALRIAQNIVQTYVSEREDIDGVVLGCTHYTVLSGGLRKLFHHLHIFSQDEIIPKKLALYLRKHTEIDMRLSKTSKRIIQFTGAEKSHSSTLVETIMTNKLGS